MIKKACKQVKQNSRPQFDKYDEPGTDSSMADQSCTFCVIIAHKPHLLVYKDEHCAIFYDKVQRAKMYFQCVPLRHIRDIHHLRPRIQGDAGEVKLKKFLESGGKMEEFLKSNPIVTNSDPLVDFNLLQHMTTVSLKFLKQQSPNNKDGYRVGFHRPPRNSQYHLHLHLIVLPLNDPARHGKTYGENLTDPQEVIDSMKMLIDQT